MAIDIDWTGVEANPYRIFIPRADMPIIQASPEQRRLDMNALRLEIKGLEASVEGIQWPDAHVHVTETVLSGSTYARFVIIKAPYIVEFEDGQYTVVATGANHNVADVKVPNQVSLVTQNSAGLINLDNVLRKFDDFIYYDENAGNTGTNEDDGTRDNPVSSVASAFSLVASQGKRGIVVLDGTFTLDRAVQLLEFRGFGDPRTSIIDFNGFAATSCQFSRLLLTGDAGAGTPTVIECALVGLSNVGGTFEDCYVDSVVLANNTLEVIFEGCRSIVAGAAGQARFDLAGRDGNVQVRAWEGGLRFAGLTSALAAVSVDTPSAHVRLDGTCTDVGDLVLRGVGLFTNESTINASKLNTLGFQDRLTQRVDNTFASVWAKK